MGDVRARHEIDKSRCELRAVVTTRRGCVDRLGGVIQVMAEDFPPAESRRALTFPGIASHCTFTAARARESPRQSAVRARFDGKAKGDYGGRSDARC